MAGVKGRSGRKDLATEGRDTRFKPGQSGNPAGSSRKERMTALLRSKLEEVLNPGTTTAIVAAEAVINALLLKATVGDTRAIEIVMDRTDGKVADKLSLDGNVTLTALNLSKLSAKELQALDQLVSRASEEDAASNS
jgi:enolase